MNGESLDIQQTNLEKLKQIFPELFAENQLDWEKLRAAFSKDINFSPERYILNWAGKSDAFKILQVSTTATLKPQPGESINFDSSENLFIEGENLEVLKILQKSYHGKVKVICIDPPYNTGSDSFIYPDKFSEKKEDYLKRIGEKDKEGNLMKEGLFRKNSKDSGHFHSNWLSMMYPRLFLAKNMLRDDGLIFVHIDDNEVHNLRLLMNEVFGEENFVAQFIWQKGAGTQNDNKYVAVSHEYILCFAKSLIATSFYYLPPTKEMLKSYKLSDEFEAVRGKYALRNLNDFSIGDRPGLHYDIVCPDNTILKGAEHRWRCDEIRYKWRIAGKRIVFEKNIETGDWQVFYKQYINEKKEEVIKDETGNILSYGKIPDTLLLKVALTGDGTRNIKELFQDNTVFNYPKPVDLIKHLLTVSTKNNDLILDFFGGSGTTGQSILELNKEDEGNRKFILVQLPEQCEENSEAFKAGYKTIADISKERIRRVIRKIGKEKSENTDLFSTGKPDLGFKVFKLASSNFKIWRGDEITEENLVQQLDAFIDPVKEIVSSEDMLYELMLKSGYLLTDKVIFDNSFYSVNDGELIIALDKIDETFLQKVISFNPKKLIALDNLFAGNDQLKTNTALQLKDAGIDFKPI